MSYRREGESILVKENRQVQNTLAGNILFRLSIEGGKFFIDEIQAFTAFSNQT